LDKSTFCVKNLSYIRFAYCIVGCRSSRQKVNSSRDKWTVYVVGFGLVLELVFDSVFSG